MNLLHNCKIFNLFMDSQQVDELLDAKLVVSTEISTCMNQHNEATQEEELGHAIAALPLEAQMNVETFLNDLVEKMHEKERKEYLERWNVCRHDAPIVIKIVGTKEYTIDDYTMQNMRYAAIKLHNMIGNSPVYILDWWPAEKWRYARYLRYKFDHYNFEHFIPHLKDDREVWAAMRHKCNRSLDPTSISWPIIRFELCEMMGAPNSFTYFGQWYEWLQTVVSSPIVLFTSEFTIKLERIIFD